MPYKTTVKSPTSSCRQLNFIKHIREPIKQLAVARTVNKCWKWGLDKCPGPSAPLFVLFTSIASSSRTGEHANPGKICVSRAKQGLSGQGFFILPESPGRIHASISVAPIMSLSKHGRPLLFSGKINWLVFLYIKNRSKASSAFYWLLITICISCVSLWNIYPYGYVLSVPTVSGTYNFQIS